MEEAEKAPESGEISIKVDKYNTIKITIVGMEGFPVTATYDEVLQLVSLKVTNEVQQRIWKEQREKEAAQYQQTQGCSNPIAGANLGLGCAVNRN